MIDPEEDLVSIFREANQTMRGVTTVAAWSLDDLYSQIRDDLVDGPYVRPIYGTLQYYAYVRRENP